MPSEPRPEPDETHENESRGERLYHAIFGRGSTYNPGGSGRLNTAGWLLVLGSVGVPMWETFTGSDTAGPSWRLAPIMFLFGVLIVRASKKPAAPPEDTDDIDPNMGP